MQTLSVSSEINISTSQFDFENIAFTYSTLTLPKYVQAHRRLKIHYLTS